MIAGFVIYDPAGRVLRTGSCPPEMLNIQAFGAGETVLEVEPGIVAEIDSDSFQVVDGFLEPLPPKPERWSVWSGDAWIDGRTEADIAQQLNAPLAALRSQRNALLTASDWTQLPDAPLTDKLKGAWREYRQALRDLPETTPEATVPVWPTIPEQG